MLEWWDGKKSVDNWLYLGVKTEYRNRYRNIIPHHEQAINALEGSHAFFKNGLPPFVLPPRTH